MARSEARSTIYMNVPELGSPYRMAKERLFADLKVEETGYKDGLKGLPPADATPATELELRIADNCQLGLDGLVRHTRQQLQHCAAMARENASLVHDLPSALQGIQDGCRDAMDRLFVASQTRISALRRQAHDLEVDLGKFRDEHDLKIGAQYPKSHFLAITILVAVVLLEAVLNAYFFARGTGLLQGLSSAALFAIANVSISFAFIGMLTLRHVHHRNTGHRALAIVLLLGLLVGVLCLNLLIGHYRAELGISTKDEALVSAVQHFWQSPFGLTNVEAWVLVVFGLVSALIATLDGYFIDDRYPGYGQITRRARDAWNAFVSSVTALEVEIRKSLEAFETQVGGKKSDALAAAARQRDLQREIAGIRDGYPIGVGEVRKIHEMALRAYREANRKGREAAVPKPKRPGRFASWLRQLLRWPPVTVVVPKAVPTPPYFKDFFPALSADVLGVDHHEPQVPGSAEIDVPCQKALSAMQESWKRKVEEARRWAGLRMDPIEGLTPIVRGQAAPPERTKDHLPLRVLESASTA